MKKIVKIMTLALVGVFALASCGDDVPAPNPNPNPGGGDEPSTEVVEITCAQAVELCAALADNASSAETYAITGYITDVLPLSAMASSPSGCPTTTMVRRWFRLTGPTFPKA